MPEHASSGGQPNRLLELLRRVGHEEPGAVGFGRPRQPLARRAPLVLIAALADASPAAVAAAQEAKVDAVLIPAAALDALSEDGKSLPVAALPTANTPVTPQELDRWTEAGADAVILRPANALGACFSPKREALFAHMDRQTSVDTLRAAAFLSVAGFVLEVTGQEGRLGGEDVLWLSMACGALRGPAILLTSSVVPEDLEALVGAGLTGVAYRVSATDAGQRLAALRATVDGLDPHLRQDARDRAGRPPVVLPFRAAQEPS